MCAYIEGTLCGNDKCEIGGYRNEYMNEINGYKASFCFFQVTHICG